MTHGYLSRNPTPCSYCLVIAPIPESTRHGVKTLRTQSYILLLSKGYLNFSWRLCDMANELAAPWVETYKSGPGCPAVVNALGILADPGQLNHVWMQVATIPMAVPGRSAATGSNGKRTALLVMPQRPLLKKSGNGRHP